MDVDYLTHIIQQFAIEGDIEQIQPHGAGHIHDSYRVVTRLAHHHNYLLQRINQQVFKPVPQLMQNIYLVTDHIQRKLHDLPDAHRRCLSLVYTDDHQLYHQDEQGDCWRVYLFLEQMVSYQQVTHPKQAYLAGLAFGHFQAQLADFPSENLSEVLPQFHHLPRRLADWRRVLEEDPAHRVLLIKPEIELISQHMDAMMELFSLITQEAMPLRAVHNDTKLNNILFSTDHQQHCIVDLDTVMPGYIHYDFSDALRTMTHRYAEDTVEFEKVAIDAQLLEQFVSGFLQPIKHHLQTCELSTLAISAPLMPYLLALRFLTDFLAGDHYFKISHPEQNLHRARVQLQLVGELQRYVPTISQKIDQLLA